MLNDTYILILDDNEESQKSSEVILNFIGEHSISYGLSQWLSAEQSRDMDKTIGMIILSLVNTDKNLEKVLKKIHETYGFTPILLLSNCDSVEITEDFDPHVKHMIVARMCNELNYSDLNDAIHRAQRYNESREQMNQQSNRRPAHLFRSLVGTSRLIKSVRTMMSQVADKDVTVLIAGESGTGKEVVARNLHYHSARREYPFVPVNCGAIPSELLESELFGHEKGAFTGAVNARAGRFELAEGGTLFLDEIGDMPLHMQVKILRVLQEKSYERVGGNKFFKTNVRIIAATHRNLEEMIEQGKFREDLYYRLNVFPIEMPSLRERSEDIPLLINELVAKLEHEKRGSIRFNSVAILSLCRHPWHGNVRELANLVERMAIMHPFGVVGVQDLPAKYRHVEVMEEDIVPAPAEESSCEPTVVSVSDVALLPENGIDLKEYISGLELSLIQQALDNTGGVVARAAEQLMIRRTTLVEKMKKYGLQRG
ncbi:sigma-54 dependent transcriptional regulator [Agarilytica rhodophyticola]|uniref:sigma-54 dependent transcriptional regulator n=1 Tax=Agarilytica rhodophyticola TaxID=1737490 RepID=UPI000B340F52|nr:sigma-54 dependent transcriptional regulator [Agarilytica rhodophyticola]